MKRNKLQNLIFNYINIKKINKIKKKWKKIIKKLKKINKKVTKEKRNAMWITIVIHIAMNVGEQ